MSLTRPNPGDPLSSSNGKPSVQIIDDIEDAIEEMQTSLDGPVFTSADSGTATTSSLILDPEAATLGLWVLKRGGLTLSPATSATHKTLGAVAVGATLTFIPGYNTALYANLASPVTRGTRTSIAIDIYWSYPSSSSWYQPGDIYELVASDTTNLGGNTATQPLRIWPGGTFGTHYINCADLTQVSSIGLQLRPDIGADPPLNSLTGLFLNAPIAFWVDNIRWAPQTELEAAMGGSEAVVIGPSYVPSVTQEIINPTLSQTVADLSGKTNITRLGGVHNVRDFGVTVEDGSIDSTAVLNQAFAQLKDGETLEFPPGAIYRLENAATSVSIRYLTNCTIDTRGCRFYSTVSRNNSFFSVVGNKNLRLKNFKINNEWVEDLTASGFSSATLTTSGQISTHSYSSWYARDHEDKIQMSVTLSDSANVAGDCRIELFDVNAPLTAPVATSFDTVGPVPAGTRFYRVSYVDGDFKQSALGPAVSFTAATNCRVNLSSIPIGGVVTSHGAAVTQRMIYRTDAGATDNPANYYAVGLIRDNTSTTFQDVCSETSDGPAGTGMVVNDTGTGLVEPRADCAYVVTYVTNTGHETERGSGEHFSLSRSATVTVTNIPVGGATVVRRRLYREKVGNTSGQDGTLFLVAEIADNTTTTFVDNIPDASLGYAAPDNRNTSQQYGTDPTIMPSVTLTLTSTPTAYNIAWYGPGQLDAEVSVRVKKLTATTNTITIGGIRVAGRIAYDPAYETNHGFNVARGNSDVLIEDCQIEGVRGDAITLSGTGVWQSNRLLIRRLHGRGSGRQGVSFNYGAFVRVEDSVLRECPRAGVDLEPETGTIQRLQHVEFDRLEMHNVTNNAFSMAGSHGVQSVRITNCRVYGVPGAGLIGGICEKMRVTDLYAPWASIDSFTVAQLAIDGLTCADIMLNGGSSGGWTGWSTENPNLKNITLTSHLGVKGDKALVTNVGVSSIGTPTGGGPFEVSGAGSASALLDPGKYRQVYPSTFRGIGAGSLWFPRGQDMLNEGMLNARALSGSSARGNNLRGIAQAVTAAASSATVTFPTRSYPNITNHTYPTATTPAAQGTLSPSTTYYYRAAARPVVGGPVTAVVEHTAVTTASGNGSTSTRPTVAGLIQTPVLIEGITLYRGTATGVYTTRYDIIPNQDWHAISDSAGGHAFEDRGSLLKFIGFGGTGWGYASLTGVTPTAGHQAWDGAKWVIQDETGWEPDANYAVWVMPSWPTTVSVTAKRMNGFDVAFGVPCPTGGGTFDWFLVR